MFTWYTDKCRKELIFNLRMMESIGSDKFQFVYLRDAVSNDIILPPAEFSVF